MIVCGPRYRAVAGVGAVCGVVSFAFFEGCGGGIGKAAVRGVRVPKNR